VEELAADGAPLPRGTDDRDASQLKERDESSLGGYLLPPLEARQRLFRKLRREGHSQLTWGSVSLDREAGFAEHVEHAPVLRQDDRLELPDSVPAGHLCQPSQHERADAFPLKVVGDGEGPLRPVVIDPLVERVADDPGRNAESSDHAQPSVWRGARDGLDPAKEGIFGDRGQEAVEQRVWR
jgi:hypothetical protein